MSRKTLWEKLREHGLASTDTVEKSTEPVD